ncbi:hypothetical protein ABW19_dt0206576 [Dactylella cylindrospora]|nr:hypothetical protein ABW19_dt0206576 [Dactylella cylindrospora]
MLASNNLPARESGTKNSSSFFQPKQHTLNTGTPDTSRTKCSMISADAHDTEQNLEACIRFWIPNVLTKHRNLGADWASKISNFILPKLEEDKLRSKVAEMISDTIDGTIKCLSLNFAKAATLFLTEIATRECVNRTKEIIKEGWGDYTIENFFTKEEVRESFIDHGAGILWDIWNPILGGLEDTIFIEAEHITERFRYLTSVILLQFIRVHIAANWVHADGDGAITSANDLAEEYRTALSTRSEPPSNSWPIFVRPLDWGTKREAPHYGIINQLGYDNDALLGTSTDVIEINWDMTAALGSEPPTAEFLQKVEEEIEYGNGVAAAIIRHCRFLQDYVDKYEGCYSN